MFGLTDGQRERIMKDNLNVDVSNPDFGKTEFEEAVLHYMAKKLNEQD